MQKRKSFADPKPWETVDISVKAMTYEIMKSNIMMKSIYFLDNIAEEIQKKVDRLIGPLKVENVVCIVII